MKNDFNYKWSKIFAGKRFKRENGFISLAPIEQHELLKDAESLVKKLTLTDVSSMFSAKQMEQAFNDGIEAEQQRCGEFDIENYC